jgi:hypothetical protein
MTDDEPYVGHGRAGALEAMLDASQEADILTDYRSIERGFDQDDYRAIIDIAWRHQFNDDRLNFKRDIRELQQHVSRRALDRLEAR